MSLMDSIAHKKLPHHLGGEQRIYRLSNGHTLSAVNGVAIRPYPFAWEFAVVNPVGTLDYSTPLTSDVYVARDQAEADDFLHRATVWASTQKPYRKGRMMTL